MSEKRAVAIYKSLLKNIAEPILTDQSTYSTDLTRVGKQLLGDDFVGVFAADKIPSMSNGRYAIVNLDKTGQAGSHWVALAKSNNNTLMYDSFGRKNIKILPSAITSGNGKIIDTDKDAEQRISEYNCGARVIAWLLLHKYWGPKMAKLI